MKFDVPIVETRYGVVTVEANSKQEATEAAWAGVEEVFWYDSDWDISEYDVMEHLDS